ncbi:AAA family ATPase [Hymenobacter chitinivorans]|uniref:HTH-type transcriptional regulator, transcriptional repressor of NAD biosynthesis genes n=1 Tax=Hymenobacter chitinivorans DSM 11115 TaxID=1121954 RepID=A0A2M9BN37_9BACT|nr:AAA family ATPase [Hymenobacter chitinivorans]PJJ59346.1 HTH-type transcriptional regulator, transcriptional repressor of NAD biosynthesis genes [Hymenobacter chitinivorans DSM 11115]
MTKAFVFGKFLPFHRGHEQLIRFALRHCDQLTVLVCASDQETVPGPLRQQWIQETFATEPRVRVQLLEYQESELPNTSETSLPVATIWADRFRQLLPNCTLVVTSEPYGELVAARMGIRHVAFDVARRQVPVSATLIRADRQRYWPFLPASVRPYYCRKVVILGAESTGKTTLATELAAHFGATLVLEAARDLIADSNHFTPDDLQQVVAEHTRRIAQAVRGGQALVIIDTDVHITQSYAHLTWGRELAVSPAVYATHRADLYLYLAADVPFVQDGTRLSATERQRLDHSHRQMLQRHNVAPEELSGSWVQRLARAVALVEQLLTQ